MSRPRLATALLAFVHVLAFGLLLLVEQGCSAGPQMVTVPVGAPVTVSCSWAADACPRTVDGGLTGGTSSTESDASTSTAPITLAGCDCLIDRSSAAPTTAPRTSGNEIRTRDVSPRVDVPVSLAGSSSE